MSAIVRIYTRQGFVIAADGRRRRTEDWSHFETVSDSVQKIFEIRAPGRFLAYGLGGTVYAPPENGEAEFDFAVEAERTVRLLSQTEPAEFEAYAERFGRSLNGVLRELQKRGRFRQSLVSNRGDGTILNVYFAGYYFGVPCWSHLRLIDRNNEEAVSVQVDCPVPCAGRIELMGSAPIAALLYRTKDSRFASYIRRKPDRAEDLTLSEAVQVAKNYIRACSDPIASEIDPECASIGGHLHLATVTQSEGFKWVIAPKSTA